MTARFHLPAMMGHRGAAALAPENTLAGLTAAAEAGCSWVEIDVMLSRDGVPVLHHDHKLHRTAGVRGILKKRTAAQLGSTNVAKAFRDDYDHAGIPTLAVALAHMLDLGLVPNIEIKPAAGLEEETAQAVLRVLAESWPDDRPVPMLSSFRAASLKLAQKQAPGYPRGLISPRPPRDWRRLLKELDCMSIHLSRRHLTLDGVEAIRSGGFGLAIYTVNDPVEAQMFRRWGASCIITDAPHLVGPALSGPLPPVGATPSRPL